MKLSYRSYPVLLFADKDKWNNARKQANSFYLNNLNGLLDKKSEEYRIAWVEYQIVCEGIMLNKPIYFVSDSFFDAVKQNQKKIIEIYEKDHDLAYDACENCIFVNKFGNIHLMHKKENNRIFYICCEKTGHIIHCAEFDKDENLKVIFSTNLKSLIPTIGGLQQMLLFKKYASVELDVIEAGKKKEVKNVERGKFINETGVDVIMLDSTWFREIIRNEGFKVRGHFRLQPYKNEKGEWTRKIIYIEEFEKHGYHRKAKMTVEQESIM